MKGAAMSELEEFKKVVSPIAYGLAYKSKLGTTEYQQLYAEEDVIKYFNNQPQLTIPKSIADELDKRWEAQNKYLQRKVTVPRDALYNAVNPYDNQLAATKIGKWIDDNQNICFAYLAGKALGVDLVKVVEG